MLQEADCLIDDKDALYLCRVKTEILIDNLNEIGYELSKAAFDLYMNMLETTAGIDHMWKPSLSRSYYKPAQEWPALRAKRAQDERQFWAIIFNTNEDVDVDEAEELLDKCSRR